MKSWVAKDYGKLLCDRNCHTVYLKIIRLDGSLRSGNVILHFTRELRETLNHFVEQVYRLTIKLINVSNRITEYLNCMSLF